MEANALLAALIEKYPFIEAIIVTDREGIEIYSGYKKDNRQKESQISILHAASIQQTNDNLLKLNKTKVQNLMLFYDNQFVYIANWNNLLLSVYTALDAN